MLDEGVIGKFSEVAKELNLPFPNVEFQALLTEVAALKPDAVYVFFAGGGAVKFVKDWAAAGLKDKIQLVGAGLGVAFLPRMIAAQRETKAVKSVLLNEPGTQWRMAMTWRRGGYLSAAAKAWLSLVKEIHTT